MLSDKNKIIKIRGTGNASRPAGTDQASEEVTEMNVLGQAVLLLSECNPRQEPKSHSLEFWPAPSVKVEVYSQNNCQIQAGDTAASQRSWILVSSFPGQGSVLPLGDVQPCSGMPSMQFRWPKRDFSFCLFTRDPNAQQVLMLMPSRYRLTDHDRSLSWQAILKQCHFPHFRNMISLQASSGWLALLLQQGFPPVSLKFELQTLQISPWWKQLKAF